MNLRRLLTSRFGISAILILQIVALMLFPAESFDPATQEWWLPVMLTLMVLIADVELVLRRSDKSWPWALISFAQGFNIISRLMMLWSHATIVVENNSIPDVPYLLLALISMVLSAVILVYVEWPETRMGLLKPLAAK